MKLKDFYFLCFIFNSIGDTLDWDFDKVSEEQDRLDLLMRLRKKGLCTRDVLAFIVNQAEQAEPY